MFSKDVPIYIDYHLKSNVTGADIAKTLCDKGFINIYLTTGTSPQRLPAMPWIKKVIDKNPPWIG